MSDILRSDEPSKESASPHSVGAWLTAIASFGAAATVIGVPLGYLELRAYYTALGAAWIVQLLSPRAFFVQAASGIAFATAVSIAAYSALASKAISRRALLKVQLSLFVISVTIGLFRRFLAEDPSGHIGWAYVSNALLVICAGIALADVMADAAGIGRRMRFVDNVFFLALASSYAFFQAPGEISHMRASEDKDPERSTLSKVQLLGEDSPHWRLIGTLETHFIVAQFTGDRPTIRIVSMTEAIKIVTHHEHATCGSQATPACRAQ